MRYWEFKDSNGYKWIVKETDNEMLDVDIAVHVMGCDWERLDQMQRDGELRFVKEGEE